MPNTKVVLSKCIYKIEIIVYKTIILIFAVEKCMHDCTGFVLRNKDLLLLKAIQINKKGLVCFSINEYSALRCTRKMGHTTCHPNSLKPFSPNLFYITLATPD